MTLFILTLQYIKLKQRWRFSRSTPCKMSWQMTALNPCLFGWSTTHLAPWTDSNITSQSKLNKKEGRLSPTFVFRPSYESSYSQAHVSKGLDRKTPEMKPMYLMLEKNSDQLFKNLQGGSSQSTEWTSGAVSASQIGRDIARLELVRFCVKGKVAEACK